MDLNYRNVCVFPTIKIQDVCKRMTEIIVRKQLFFDDNKLFGADNIIRKYGRPEWISVYNDSELYIPCKRGEPENEKFFEYTVLF